MRAGRRLDLSTPKRRWTANLALAAATSVMTLALLEAGARALFPDVVVRLAMYRPAADVVYELRPGFRGVGQLGEAIRVNTAGLRGEELQPAGGPATRVVVVGDSFTFGLGVAENETFPAALGALLGRNVEVLNAGVPGYNLYQERRLIERRLERFEPDAVVLVLIENDLYNVDGSDLVPAGDGTLARREGGFHPDGNVNPFAALSGPWLWLQLHSVAFREATFAGIRAQLARTGDRELAARARAVETSPDLPSRLLRGEEDAETAPRWRAAEQELAAAVAGAGAPLIVVLFPRPEQLYSQTLCVGFERLARIARSAGAAAVIDPTATLAGSRDRVRLYLFPHDHHPSAGGYAAAARVAAPALAAVTGSSGTRSAPYVPRP